jgi:hypothetical protein
MIDFSERSGAQPSSGGVRGESESMMCANDAEMTRQIPAASRGWRLSGGDLATTSRGAHEPQRAAPSDQNSCT